MSLLFETLEKIEKINKENKKIQENRFDSLLKTPKGLGKLEDLSIQFEGIQKNYKPQKKMVLVMAADNGVEVEKVSKSHRLITQYVVEAMLNEKSSINALARSFNSDVRVVDLGIDQTTIGSEKINLDTIINEKLMEKGTKNIVIEDAMTEEIVIKAIEIGIKITEEFIKKGYNLFATGEMGIGNTTTSSAILKILSDLSLDEIVGYGSGIDDKTLEHKKNVIKKAIDRSECKYKEKFSKKEIIKIISSVGGLDIAGMVGIYLAGARYKVPIVIDGFISSVAALLAYKLCENSRDYMIASHISEEPGMKFILKELEKEPFLNMNMKLGEGSGAIIMFPLIEASCNIVENVRKYPEIK